MNITGAAVDLGQELHTVCLAWEEVREAWRDAVAREFEEERWAPLENQTRAVLQAMDRLGPVLAKAMRDCA